MNTIQTILSGCLGGLSFGMYHSYITHKQNKEFDNKMKQMKDQMIKRVIV